MNAKKHFFEKTLFSVFILWVLYQAAVEFFAIASGTGTWYKEFSRSWFLLYIAFIVICLSVFSLATLAVWSPASLNRIFTKTIALRNSIGNFRWFLWMVIFILPIWFFQYTVWGIVFQKLYIRLLIWGVVILALTILASPKGQLFAWGSFLTSVILTASAFSIMSALKEVSAYPFSLGWSEGNRLWDYSIMFARERYIYPPDKNIFVLLDRGRQFIGGLPFLIPNVDIVTVRVWVGLLLVIPYLIVGAATFRFLTKEKFLWLLMILWVFLFLKQGPIHPPLVIVATLTVLAWRSPYWLAIPLMFAAGYLAQASRFTWVYAPPLWIAMLEIASASFSDRKTATPTFIRVFILASCSLIGSFSFVPILNTIRNFSLAESISPVAPEAQTPVAPTPAPSNPNPSKPFYISYIETIIKNVQDQPLLWYRLLPNSTYGSGILFALFLAVAPLSMLLYYLIKQKVWVLNRFQKITLLFPLLAFLAVGLVASTKIGGGGDLHNMDMFLIAMMFVGMLAWKHGGKAWLNHVDGIPLRLRGVIVFMLVISSIAPLFQMRSYTFGEKTAWLRTLTDSSETNTLEMLPTQEVIQNALQTIQTEVDKAKQQGDVLFIDQRQLLTFGYITNVPLIPTYEKKLLMNEALSGNATYFKNYYAELASQRFSLIISEPLRTPIQDSNYHFGEENNAWVTWVAIPTLCYYEPLLTLKEVRVQLLIPAEDTDHCASVLPTP